MSDEKKYTVKEITEMLKKNNADRIKITEYRIFGKHLILTKKQYNE